MAHLTVDDDLRPRFAAALESGRTEGPPAEAIAAELLKRWGEPQRRYHTVDHLRDVLGRLDELTGQRVPVTVELAAWFHDAVYDPAGQHNEDRSADLAEALLTDAKVPASLRQEVARLVRLTTGHDPADGDTSGALLCDADLAVLAGPPAEYAAYATAVRQEYGFVTGDAFRDGRAAVLRRLLALPRLFHTPYGARHWEATARYNLSAELALLSG